MDVKEIYVNKESTIKEAMKIIDKGGLRIAFVTDNDGRLAGVVTDGDIRRAILQGTNLKAAVKKFMNVSPITAQKDWTEGKIKKFLQANEIRNQIPKHGTIRIPVLDNNNRVVDIIFASEETYEMDVNHKIEFKDKIKNVKPVNKILVVGGAGFLGSVLCKKLLDRGYTVRVLDNLTYGIHGLREISNHPKFGFIKGDRRDIQTAVEAVKGIDAVIHLAAIVGDPASALDPEETIEIDYLGTRMLADVCRYSQINRFIFASTCSVYGASPTPEAKLHENSQLNPVSLYAEMKLKSEQGISELVDGNFSPTILRMGTLYGLSPRMRFDLVVNTLTIKAIKEKTFTIFGGNQWRPNLHVDDAAEAYIACLEAPIKKVKGKIFNVGSNEENYKIVEIGEIINNLIPETKMIIDKKKIDERNYNVSFDNIKEVLGYSTKYTISNGVNEIKEAVEKGEFSDHAERKYSNYKFLQQNQYFWD